MLACRYVFLNLNMLLLDIIKIKGMEIHATSHIGNRRRETVYKRLTVGLLFFRCVLGMKLKVCLYRLIGCQYVCVCVYAKCASDQLFNCN